MIAAKASEMMNMAASNAETSIVEQWLSTPLIVTAAIAIATLLVSIGIWVGRVNEGRGEVKKFMEEIRDDIKKIFRALPGSTVTSASPLRLTDLGETISERLNASQWANHLVQELRPQIEGRNQYQIQEFCQGYVTNQRFEDDQEFLTLIQVCAFDHGLTESQVRDVLMVELRDALLESTGHSISRVKEYGRTG